MCAIITHQIYDYWVRKWSDGLLCSEDSQPLGDRRLQIVCSVLCRWLVMALINASVDAWDKGVEQLPSARTAGVRAHLPWPLPLQGFWHGILRGNHTVPGGWAQRGFPVTPRTAGPLNPGLCCWRLCCSLVFTSGHAVTVSSITRAVRGGCLWHLAWPKSSLCTQCLIYAACGSLPKLATSLLLLLVSH